MWCWQKTIAEKYTRENILDDVLQDNSMIFEMAKEDVAKILQKTNYNFVVQRLHYDDIYGTALEVTKKQVIKILERKKGFLFCKNENCSFENLDLVRKIVQRVANNIKNLFDDRYKNCIKKSIKEELINNFDDAYEDDLLDILIEEETQKEKFEKQSLEQQEHIEYLKKIIKVDSSGQTLLYFT